MIFCIDFDDDGPDRFGRRRFTLTWKGTVSIMSREPGKQHIEIGRGPGVRAQCFYAPPDRFYPGGPR